MTRFRPLLAAFGVLVALAVPARAAAPNLALNPGFETACGATGACSWSGASGGAVVRSTATAHTGSASLQTTTNADGPAGWGACVTLTGGATYDLNGWAATTSANVVDGRAGLTTYAGAICTGSAISSAAPPLPQGIRKDGRWTRFSTTVNVPAGAGSGRITLGAQCTTCGVVVGYDDVALGLAGPPTITSTAYSSLSPLTPYDGAWTRNDVWVRWACAPFGVSPIVSCSSQQLIDFTSDGVPSGVALQEDSRGASGGTARVRIDRTPPVVAITALADDGRTIANGGWTNGPLDVSVACSDAHSGLAPGTVCPAPSHIAGDAAYTTPAIADLVGNTATATYQARLDTVAPTASVALTTSEGTYVPGTWSRLPVTATWTCGDVGSGLATPCPGPTTVATDGSSSTQVRVRDVAGNQATASTGLILIDRTAPSIAATATVGGEPYRAGTWATAPVTVHFDCADAGSGLAAPCPADQVIDADGVTTATASVDDVAGNRATATLGPIRVDTTLPYVRADLTVHGAPYDPGTWTKGPVVVHWTCVDPPGGSGVATDCPLDETYADDGMWTALADVADAAGNSNSAIVTGIQVDATPPAITLTHPAQGENFAPGVAVPADFACEDALSTATCDGTVAPGDLIDTATKGSRSFTVTSTDEAGNTAVQAIDYGVDLVPLTVTSRDAASAYGAPLPRFSVTARGFVAGDTLASLTGRLVCGVGSPYPDPGAHPIACGGLHSGRYAIRHVAGTLTVRRPPRATAAVVTGRAIAIVRPTTRVLPFACGLPVLGLQRCTLELFATAGGVRTLVGRATARAAAPGRRPVALAVPVDRATRALAAQPGGVGLTLVATAQQAGYPTPVRARVPVQLVPTSVVTAPTDGIFAAGESTVPRAGTPYLRTLRQLIRGARAITCTGHTDNRGSTAYNYRLGLERAKAVCAFLVRGTRIRSTARSLGETHPRASNATPEGRARNRYVDVAVRYG